MQSLGTEFDIVAGQVSSRVWNTDIETAIDGIEVGGRNLIRNSNFSKGLDGWRSNSDAELATEEGRTGVKITSDNGIYSYPTELEEDVPYTVSFLAKSLGETSSLRVGLLNQSNMSYSPTIDDNLRRYSFTFNGTVNLSMNQYLHVYRASGDPVFITEIQLEQANITMS